MITRRNIIKEKRESKNISLEELSSKLNISLNELKKIENFEVQIDYKKLNIIKDELDITDQEIKEYFDSFYEVKTNESKTIKVAVSLFLIAFAFSIFFYVETFGIRSTNYFYIWIIGLFGFSFLIGSYSLFCFSKSKISNLKYIIYLVILTILLGFSLYIYFKAFGMIYRDNLTFKPIY